MKKKLFTYLYIGLFLLALLLPGLGMLLGRETQPRANESLALPPRLTDREGAFNWAVLRDFSDYMDDRFAFRHELVTVWAGLNARLLHSSVEEQVVLGREGWLYFAETLDDYMGRGLSDGQLQSAARNLALMQEYVRSQGAEFLFTVAPNKNSLYPRYMPGSVSNGREGANAVRLPAYLAAEGVRYADLFAPFQQREEVLYYRMDSHWTSRGAALAADTLLTALGRDSAVFEGDFSQGAPHLGDLYQMLYPAGTEREADLAPSLPPYETEGDPRAGDAITIRSHAQAPGALLCYRDSFGAALYPYLAARYGDALFSRQEVYDLTRMEELGADTVLIELVERNLDRLLTHPAVFPAPVRTDPPQGRESGETVSAALSAGTGAALEGLMQVRGALPEGTDFGAPVYLRAGGLWYEASVTLEADGSAGFSAWIPAPEDGELTLLSLRGGWCLSACAGEYE